MMYLQTSFSPLKANKATELSSQQWRQNWSKATNIDKEEK